MKHTWNWLWQRIKTRFPAIMVLVASQVSVAVLGVVFALVTRNVIDSAVQQNADAFVRDCVIQGAIIAALILCNVLYRHQHDILMAELDRDWKKDLPKGLLRSDYPTVSAFHSGELLNRMNNDVRILNTGFLETLPSVMALVTRLIAAVVVLTALEPWFALVMCLGGLVDVNHVSCTATDKTVSPGDIVSVRGYGKFIIDSFNGETRSGRARLSVRKYL